MAVARAPLVSMPGHIMLRGDPMFRYLTTTAIVALAIPAAATAQPAAKRHQFDIRGGDLATALNAFSRQAGVQILFPSDAVVGRSAKPLRGSFTRDAALRRLIAGQPLIVGTQSATMIALRATPAARRPAVPIADSTAPDTDGEDADIIVLGSGQSRQMQTLTPTVLAKAAPGTSPLQSLAKLPGVDFVSSDPLGAYEWAQQITIRGFTTDQMGYTLDGVPLGNMQYRNNNGLAIGRALITENNGPVTLSQGSGALGTASTSNIGGTIDFTSLAPTSGFGIDLAQTYGSADTWRSFARINSGTLPGGGRLALSFAYQHTGKWKGEGKQLQRQINAKLVQPLGDAVTATTYLNLQDRREDDYADVSFDLVGRLGWRVDNVTGDFALAEALARALQNGTAVPAPYRNADDVYYNGGGVRRDLLAYQRFDYRLSDAVDGHSIAYLHLDKGIGTFASPYDPSPAAFGGSPISVSAVSYAIDRKGVISRLSVDLGDHRIEGGIWYERNRFHQRADFYGLQAGTPPRRFQKFYENPFFTRWDYVFTTDVAQIDMGDTWRVSDALRLNAGVKALVTSNDARTITSRQPIDGTIRAANGFLPTVGALYRIDARNEVFADYTRNMAGFIASAASGPFSTTQAGFDFIRRDLKPETTNTIEAGYRYRDDRMQATLTGYYVRFRNRLLASSISATVVGNQNVLQNVGGVTSRGVEGAANWRFAPFWSLYGSWGYNVATYDDDVVVPGRTAVRIAGNQVVAAPRHVGNLELGYDDDRFWAQAAGHYRSRRFHTFTNDRPVPGSATLDLSAGYRLTGNRAAPGIELLANVTNLFDRRYYASLGTSGFRNADPDGTYTTLQVAPPRQVYATLRAHF